MKNINFLIVNALLLLLLTFMACKPAQVARQHNLIPMPERYSDAPADSMHLGQMNWRDYFKDEVLVRLLEVTLSNNLDLKIAARRVQQMQSGVLASEADLKPFVEAATNIGLRKFGLYTMDGAGNITTDILPGKIVPIHLPDYFVGLQASWEVDLWGKLRNRKKAAAARLLASVEGQHLVQTAIVANVAAAYFELQSLDAQLLILDEYIALQQNALDIVRIQKEAGEANLLGVRQFESQLLELRGMRLDIQQRIVEQENMINFLAGRYPLPILRRPLFLDQPLPEITKTGAPAHLLENRPDVRAAALELAAAKADLDAARALFYPSLQIGAALGVQAFRPDLLVTSAQSAAYSLLGGLAAPLVNKKSIRAAFNFADAHQEEAFTQYQQSILGAFVETYNQITNLRNLDEQFALKLEQSAAISSAVDISADLFRTGRANYLEVLAAQQNALDTRFELIEIRLRQWQSAIQLYRALGGGWR